MCLKYCRSNFQKKCKKIPLRATCVGCNKWWSPLRSGGGNFSLGRQMWYSMNLLKKITSKINLFISKKYYMSRKNIKWVNYDDFATTFWNSREGMKWQEIEYFLEKYNEKIDGKKILDIGCGNGRLLDIFIKSNAILDIDYFWMDASSGMIDEAKKKFWSDDFFVGDMLKLCDLKHKNFESVFFIASFHHLLSFGERVKVLQDLKKNILPGTYIFLTNWALESKLNKEKYLSSLVWDSENEFWGKDFMVKIGMFERFYHSFTLEELTYIFETTWYEIIENRLFENERNIISIIRA